MKNRLTILIGIFIFLGVSCQKDNIDFYNGPDAINITADGDGAFIKSETNQEKTFSIILSLQGNLSSRDRVVEFETGADNTAKIGENVEIPMKVVLEAGRLDTIIECKAFRDGLSSDPLILDLRIKKNTNFEGGTKTGIQVKLLVGYPTSWVHTQSWMPDYYFGKCTQEKYKFVEEQLGVIDLSAYGMWDMSDLVADFNAILDANPRYNEDGTPMRFSSAT